MTKAEKDFWPCYVALHIMRNPTTISSIQGLIQDEAHGYFSEQEIRNIAVAYCLPFFSAPNSKELTPFLIFLSVLHEMVLTVVYAESDNLFTSDRTMYGIKRSADNSGIIKPERVWFPVSSNCALLFSAPETVGRSMRNRLITLTVEEIRSQNKEIAYGASQMVLSKHPFSKEDIRLIKEARREKEQDSKKLAG